MNYECFTRKPAHRRRGKNLSEIITLCARYNSGEDPGIVMRGWDADLKTLITQKLSRLGICVLVCAPKRKPLQEQGGTNAVILTTKIVIESNPLLKNPTQPPSSAGMRTIWQTCSPSGLTGIGNRAGSPA